MWYIMCQLFTYQSVIYKTISTKKKQIPDTCIDTHTHCVSLMHGLIRKFALFGILKICPCALLQSVLQGWRQHTALSLQLCNLRLGTRFVMTGDATYSNHIQPYLRYPGVGTCCTGNGWNSNSLTSRIQVSLGDPVLWPFGEQPCKAHVSGFPYYIGFAQFLHAVPCLSKS